MGVVYLFGDCGCCRGALSAGPGGEAQSVFAYQPYPAGSTAFDYRGGPVPETCYLSRVDQYVNSDGTVVYQSSSLFDPRDNATQDDPDWPPIYLLATTPFDGDIATPVVVSTLETRVTYQNGAYSRTFLSKPYTYEAAVANVVAMLDNVRLLDPVTAYRSVIQNVDFFLCYPSEAAAMGYNPSTYYNGADLTTFFVGAAPYCVAHITVLWVIERQFGSYGPILSAKIGYRPSEPLFGQPATYSEASNGFSLNNYKPGDFTPSLGPFVCALKMVARLPYALTRRDDYLLNSGTRQFPAFPLSAPASISPGENIFLPSDVPGYGRSVWRTDAVPTLPPARPTADSTTSTADSTTPTADSL